jgi:hypothetical protein
MKTFKEWLTYREMAGTGVVMGNSCKTPNVGPDAQVWGAPAASCQSMKKHKHKKAKK